MKLFLKFAILIIAILFFVRRLEPFGNELQILNIRRYGEEVNIQIIGGTPPYQILIQDESGEHVVTYTKINLPFGYYWIRVWDARKKYADYRGYI